MKIAYIILSCYLESYNRVTFSNAEDAINRFLEELKHCDFVEFGMETKNGYIVIDQSW